MALLPYLDQQGTYDRWDFNEPWDSDTTTGEHTISNRELSGLLIEAFSCPKDTTAFQMAGGLSYVVNCGVGDSDWVTMSGLRESTQVVSGQHPQAEPFDWNGDREFPPYDVADAEINRDFMLFWPVFDVPEELAIDVAAPEPHCLGKIFDGSSNTIMLAENINAGTSPGNSTASWADPKLSSSGFLLPIDATRVSPTVHGADGSLASLVVSEPLSPAINAALKAGDGRAPFPNSNHPGVGVVSWCDGSVRTISEDIDMQVYARLLTPSGTRLREIPGFVSEELMQGDDF